MPVSLGHDRETWFGAQLRVVQTSLRTKNEEHSLVHVRRKAAEQVSMDQDGHPWHSQI